MDIASLVFAAAGIALGGFLKGATGAGVPIVGVPVLALILGVPQAVAVFSVLNLLSNSVQAWQYRAALGPRRLIRGFALWGAIGTILGSVLLTTLPTEVLMASLACVVFAYIGLRLLHPGWRISRPRGERLAPAAGFAGGMMQGAGGISAPVSITFLNAMRLERPEFIATISAYFMIISALQAPTLAALGVLTWDRAAMSLLAALPMFGAMPLGEMAARRISKTTFDRIILGMLAVIAARLMYAALT